jgi:uracil phosphoribosyltransferase
MERIAEVAAYEISKTLAWEEKEITTPLGIANCKVLQSQPVLATILRAGLGMHNGLLNYFDKGENAFISAYRKHNPDGGFEISIEYISCPELDDKVLIISDPMIATGASLVKAIQYLKQEGVIKKVHIVCAIACTVGIEFVLREQPKATIWCGDIDDEITGKGYIVPGLGDAGDLAYGQKMQY